MVESDRRQRTSHPADIVLSQNTFIHSSFKELDWEKWPLVAEYPELEVAIRASVKAGQMLHAAYYSKEYEVYLKDDSSEFTPFDKRAEEIARVEIRKVFPNAVIMGEELGGSNG